MRGRILLVDLNNFARYPSVAIGYLTAILRAGGFEVELLAPFSTGIGGVPREPRSPWWGRLDLEFRYRTAVSRNRLLRRIRAQYASLSCLQTGPIKAFALYRVRIAGWTRDSTRSWCPTYLMYYPHCVALGQICRRTRCAALARRPIFRAQAKLRGSGSTFPDCRHSWAARSNRICASSYAVSSVARATEDLPASGTRGERQARPECTTACRPRSGFLFRTIRSFHGQSIPNTIVPIVTGRGCGWGVCTFCSDVTSTVGRTFRSRSPENVLAELSYPAWSSRRHVSLFSQT